MSYGPGPWGYPYGCPPQPPGFYVQAPQGMSPEQAVEWYEKMEKKFSERKKSEDDKKKDEAKKKEGAKPPMFSLLQVFMMLMVFGLPVGTGQFLLLKACIKALKESF